MTQKNLIAFVEGLKKLDCDVGINFLKEKMPSMNLVTLLKLFKLLDYNKYQIPIFKHTKTTLSSYKPLENSEIMELQQDFDSSLLRFILFNQYQDKLSYDYLERCSRRIEAPDHKDTIEYDQVFLLLLKKYPEKISTDRLMTYYLDGVGYKASYSDPNTVALAKNIFLKRNINLQDLVDILIAARKEGDSTFRSTQDLVTKKITSLYKRLLDKNILLRYIGNEKVTRVEPELYYLLIENFIDVLELEDCLMIYRKAIAIEANVDSLITRISYLIEDAGELVLVSNKIHSNYFKKMLQSQTVKALNLKFEDIRYHSAFYKNNRSLWEDGIENLKSIYLMVKDELSEKSLRAIIYDNEKINDLKIIIVGFSVELLLEKFSDNVSLDETKSLAEKADLVREDAIKKLLISHGRKLCERKPTFENILLFYSYIDYITKSCGDDAEGETLFELIRYKLQYNDVKKMYDEYSSIYENDRSPGRRGTRYARGLPVLEYLLKTFFEDKKREEFGYLESLLD